MTGQITAPVRTVPKVSGLIAVGGHTAGDALLCFDKAAFTSYGFSQTENAVVSESAITSVNAALQELIAQAPIQAGVKMVHWYKEPVKQEEDVFANFFGAYAADNKEDADGTDFARKMDTAMAAANALIQSVKKGENPQQLENKYYLMPLSGANGRMMVRGWDEGSYEDLYQNIKLWYDDLRIVLDDGSGTCKSERLSRLEDRLLKPTQSASKNLGKQTAEELSGIQVRILYSILHGKPLPDAVGKQALRYIRSHMLVTEDNKGGERNPDLCACQLLKAWIIRKQRSSEKGEIFMKEAVNHDYPSDAYQCGRLMAVYAEIQKSAYKNRLNAGVIERYYTGASTTPALVLGRLSSLSQYHLGKIESEGTRVFYQKMLDEIYTKLNPPLPTALSPLQQGEFAVGYHQQHAEIYKSKKGTD